MKQENLFHGEQLPPRIRYGELFGRLPEIPSQAGGGRPRTDPNALLRCLVYRCLRALPTLSDLAVSLADNPSLAEAAGFPPWARTPGVERFSSWLRETDNATLQRVRLGLVRRLVEQGAVRGRIVALDGSPVPSPVRENNLKTSVANRFDKHRFPRTDPEARLGVYRAYVGTQKIRYFWGYRNHVAADFETELPLWEETHPANRHESRSAIPLLLACSRQLGLPVEVVCADSAYDSEKILVCVIEELHARPVIAPNARRNPSREFRIKGKSVLCAAGLEMVHKGRMTPKKTGITYRQYCCPLHYRKKSLQRSLLCPAMHPKFLSQKGCNCLIREKPSLRLQIPYGSAEFAALYRKRGSVERVFSRLLSLTMQKPTVRGLNAVRNHCTIAHIAVLLVAAAAHHLGHPDKIAFVRSFVPNFLHQD